jgi:mycofactocin precursor
MDSTTSTGSTATLPAPPQDLVDEPSTALVDDDLLVEDVSIDGMCGVY